jgi:mannose-6-phosphate isomerase-like protein (cupin superfamily)
MVVSVENAEHYIWGEICDGWHLLKREDMTVIRERVPAGAAEMMHYHAKARQFFYILDGEATMAFEDRVIPLRKGQGIEIAPQVRHQFRNQSDADVDFLVISVPSTRGDRINTAQAAARAERSDAPRHEVEVPGEDAT